VVEGIQATPAVLLQILGLELAHESPLVVRRLTIRAHVQSNGA